MCNDNIGPVFGVGLIDDLPIGTGPMRQACPSRAELEAVREVSERTASAYEVLLAHYKGLKAQLGFCLVGFRQNKKPPKDRLIFGEWETEEGYPNVIDFYRWNDEAGLFQYWHGTGIAFRERPLWWAECHPRLEQLAALAANK